MPTEQKILAHKSRKSPKLSTKQFKQVSLSHHSAYTNRHYQSTLHSRFQKSKRDYKARPNSHTHVCDDVLKPNGDSQNKYNSLSGIRTKEVTSPEFFKYWSSWRNGSYQRHDEIRVRKRAWSFENMSENMVEGNSSAEYRSQHHFKISIYSATALSYPDATNRSSHMSQTRRHKMNTHTLIPIHC